MTDDAATPEQPRTSLRFRHVTTTTPFRVTLKKPRRSKPLVAMKPTTWPGGPWPTRPNR